MWLGSRVMGFVFSVVGRTESPGLSIHGVGTAMAWSCCSSSLSTLQGHPLCSRGERDGRGECTPSPDPVDARLGLCGSCCLSSALGLLRDVLNPLKLLPALKELMPLPADVIHSVPSRLSCWASGIQGAAQEQEAVQMLSHAEPALPLAISTHRAVLWGPKVPLSPRAG